MMLLRPTFMISAISFCVFSVISAFSAEQSFDVISNKKAGITVSAIKPGATLLSTIQSNDNNASSISPDGKLVSFYAGVTDDPILQYSQVYVRAFSGGDTKIISTSSSNDIGNYPSFGGQFLTESKIVFTSAAGNLTQNSTLGVYQIYLKDLNTGQTSLVSQSESGQAGNSSVDTFSVSRSGKCIAYTSSASNIYGADLNNKKDVFLYDLGTQKSKIVSTTQSGAQGNGDSYSPFPSDDCRTVIFSSNSTNFPGGAANSIPNLFLKNVKTGSLERLLSSFDSKDINGAAEQPILSSDGRSILFQSLATNLSKSTVTPGWNVYIYNIKEKKTDIVSTNGNKVPFNNWSFNAGFLGNSSNLVMFYSMATNVSNFADINTWDQYGTDLFLKDLNSNQIFRLSVGIYGQINRQVDFQATTISPRNGSTVIFSTRASNVVDGDANDHRDLFWVGIKTK
ncbi:TolB family protein [Prosthecomicrobium hirschii]|uniref:TolB family protein n=1 Tax=Prosthecodimorpha hirschii TaxID=665126 RepID=UPI00128F951E|nr:hypothetical protein [Prosthecomicrobium hirschii]